MEDKKLGAELRDSVVNKLLELSLSCKKSHSEISVILEDLALDIGMLSNRLSNDNGNVIGDCKVTSYVEEITGKEVVGETYRFFDSTRIKLKGK